MFHEDDLRRKATGSLKMTEEQDEIMRTTQGLKQKDAEKQPPTSRQRPPHKAPDSAEVSRSQISIDAVHPGPVALYEKYNSIAQRTANIKTFGSLNHSRHQENEPDQRARLQPAENACQVETENQGQKPPQTASFEIDKDNAAQQVSSSSMSKHKPEEPLASRQQPLHNDRPKILIVDDEIFNLATLQTLIKIQFKLESETVSNGEEAIERV